MEGLKSLPFSPRYLFLFSLKTDMFLHLKLNKIKGSCWIVDLVDKVLYTSDRKSSDLVTENHRKGKEASVFQPFLTDFLKSRNKNFHHKINYKMRNREGHFPIHITSELNIIYFLSLFCMVFLFNCNISFIKSFSPSKVGQ